ncbi:exodeoxyribonuclease III [PVC group bacterium (ex Bugula neritina AB1)]|nr:exodeoxyribonuclease III [PVC group bacterium (ex Bugula neritina AB1)]
MSRDLISWNVNGLRSIWKKSFQQWLENTSPDIVCLQEIRSSIDQIPSYLTNHPIYNAYWAPSNRKGYSGVACLTKEKPLEILTMGISEFDEEGRFQALVFEDFVLINAYFPNSQENRKRLDYKLSFCESLLEKAEHYKSLGKNIIICGDYNIAHQAIDLKRPSANENSPGYYEEERAWMSSFLQKGYTDVFRELNPEKKDCYSWWSYRSQARSRNVGWRIDYHCIDQDFMQKVEDVSICKEVMGSDHCPVLLKLKN